MSLQNILNRGSKASWLAGRQSRITPGRASSSDKTNSPNKLPGKALYGLGRFALKVYARLMLKLDVVWEAQLPDGPKIIAANHPTTTDPFFITLLTPEQASILIHETLFKVPMFGRYLRQAGHVVVVPGNGRLAFEQARRLLEAGRTVVIFPEGGLSPIEGGYGKPCTGVARLSLVTGAPVIPVGIHLPRERVRLVETRVDGKPEVGRWYLRGPYALTVGKPMRFKGNVEDRAYVRSISESILQRIIFLAHQSSHRIRGLRAIPPAPITQPVKVAASPQ